MPEMDIGSGGIRPVLDPHRSTAIDGYLDLLAQFIFRDDLNRSPADDIYLLVYRFHNLFNHEEHEEFLKLLALTYQANLHFPHAI